MYYFQTSIKTILLRLKPISFIGFLFFSPLTFAQQWYHVELIVFEQLNNTSAEQGSASSIPSASVSPNTTNKYMQPSVNSTLLDSAAKLKRSSAYRVHYHQSWRQPIQTKSQAQSVQIVSDNDMIYGRLRLHKGTYLYATLDLQLNRVSRQNNNWSDANAVRKPYLQEARRVRSKKLHFFDHPNLGALLKLTPIASSASLSPSQAIMHDIAILTAQ